MSSLFERLQTDLGAAMKAGNEIEKSTLLMAIATIKNAPTAGGEAGALTDANVIRMLQAEVKKRRKAADMYKDAGRGASEKTQRIELAILARYLPVSTDNDDLSEIVATEVASATAAAAAAGMTGPWIVGQIINAVRTRAGANADAAAIATLVEAALSATSSVMPDRHIRTSESQVELGSDSRQNSDSLELVPSSSEWHRFSYSQKSCAEAVGRAQSALASDSARSDINEKLGTKAEEILAVACNSIGCDLDSPGSKTGYPVMQVHPSVLDYLGLNPDDFGGVQFAMTLGSYLDPQIGVIPVIFAGCRYQRTERVVALVWSFLKCGDSDLRRQREDFAALARSHIDVTDDQGGLVEMSRMAVMVGRPRGGLDAMTGPFFIPLKLWRYLSIGVFHNAQGASAEKSTPPWPHPLRLSGMTPQDNLFESRGASRFLKWY